MTTTTLRCLCGHEPADHYGNGCCKILRCTCDAYDPVDADDLAPRAADLPLGEPQPVDERPTTVEQLLARADACELPKARTLAGRVRDLVTELYEVVEQHQAETEARARIAQAEAELAAARAALKGLRGAPPPAPASRPTADDRPKDAVVRAWCQKNGVECSAHGRVPQSAVDAYLARGGAA